MRSAQKKESDRALRIKSETLTCRHFDGVQHDECKAGVNYRALAGEPRDGCMTRIPCLPFTDPKHGAMAVCDKRSTWTQAEAEQMVDASKASMKRHMLAFRAAHDDAKAKRFGVGHGGADSLQCPACEKGRLYYRVAGLNGHMHAKCDTDGCVQWME